MIKVGLIGCGKISVGHLHAFDKIADANITAACDISEPNLKVVTDHTGAVGYTDYKKMVEEEDLDLVVITLPHGLHGEATCFCAEHGLDVFLEKPMGISSEDCEKMIECCKKNNVMLWVGHLQRYFQFNVFAKSLIDSGKYGKLISFTETRAVDYFSDSRPRWFLDKKMSGGGIMINLGAHALDKLKYFSDSNVKEVSGAIHLHEGSECEDIAHACVIMENGVCGMLNLIGQTGTSFYEYVLYLTEGEIRIHQDGTVEYCGKDGVFKCKQCDNTPGMQYQIKDLIDVVRSGKKVPTVSGEYGLDIIKAIKMLYNEE